MNPTSDREMKVTINFQPELFELSPAEALLRFDEEFNDARRNARAEVIRMLDA